MVMILIINNSLIQKGLLQKPTKREGQKAINYQILTLLYFAEGVGQIVLDCMIKVWQHLLEAAGLKPVLYKCIGGNILTYWLKYKIRDYTGINN